MIKEKVEEQNERQVKMNQKELTHKNERKANMKKMNLLKTQKGFTLAETLITLTILGVVAAITVPSLINKQIESANRTKVKKAMAVYEKALNQMIIDNDIKGNVSALNGNTCETTRPYFKTIENGETNCQFKTADRIWWDISDIENPIISLKEEITNANLNRMKSVDARNDVTKKVNNTVFGMVGRRVDGNILRINDYGYESQYGSSAQKAYVSKLYGFINNSMEQEVTCASDDYSCILKKDPTSYTQIPTCATGQTRNCMKSCNNSKCNLYRDDNTGKVMSLYLQTNSVTGEKYVQELSYSNNLDRVINRYLDTENFVISVNPQTGEYYLSRESHTINGDMVFYGYKLDSKGEVYKYSEQKKNYDGSESELNWKENSVTGEIFQYVDTKTNADGSIIRNYWDNNHLTGEVYHSVDFVRNADGSEVEDVWGENYSTGKVYHARHTTTESNGSSIVMTRRNENDEEFYLSRKKVNDDNGNLICQIDYNKNGSILFSQPSGCTID